MFGEELHLREYWNVIRKWRWCIIAVVLPLILLALLISLKSTPVYKATARILIEKTTPNIVSFADPGTPNSVYRDPEFLATQIKIIKSYAIAKKTLEKLGMPEQTIEQPPPQQAEQTFLEPEWIQEPLAWCRESLSKLATLLGVPDPPELSDTAKIAIEEERFVQKFAGMISITPVRGTCLVDVGATSSDSEQAAQIANTLVETYIEYTLDTKAAASRNAVRWLLDEAETAKKKLAESEAALQQYKEQHGILSFEDRQNIVMQKLSDLSTAVNNAKIRRIGIEAQYREIQHYEVSQLATVPQIMNNPAIQSLKVELSRLEGELSDLQKKFRDKHPTILASESQIEAIQSKIEAEALQIIESMQKEYELASVQEKELSKALEVQKAEALELNQKAIQYGILAKDVESNQRIYDALLQRTKETSITERLETTNIQLVNRATIPTSPITPQKSRILFLAGAVGLAVGISLAFFLEYWNDTIVVPDDLKRYLGISVLAVIPKISTKHILPHEKKTATDTLTATIVLTDPKSTIAEAYRGLRTQVTFSDIDEESSSIRNSSILLVTSPEPAEGKSCTVANLGIAMAQSGQKTLIIDADLRKPVMEQIFHLKKRNDKKYGLADVLMNVETTNGIRNMLYKTDIRNLHVIPCGTIPPNPSELLSMRKMAVIIHKLSKYYERILIDSPPVNIVTDPLILAQFVTSVLLIFRAGKTKRQVAQRAAELLHGVGASVIGGVMNRVEPKKARYSYYYYYGDYYSQPGKPSSSEKLTIED